MTKQINRDLEGPYTTADNRIKIIEYKNREILLLDYSNLSPDQLAHYALTGLQFTKSLGRYDLLILVDVTGTYTYGSGYEAIKKAAIQTIPYTKRDALVGATGAKLVLLNVFNALRRANTRAFTSREKALEYLIS